MYTFLRIKIKKIYTSIEKGMIRVFHWFKSDKKF